MFGLMPNAHAGFGNAIQGAMDQMWKVNSANQQASLAQQALGGSGRGGQQGPSPWDAYFGLNLTNPYQSEAYGRAKGTIREQNIKDNDYGMRFEQQRRNMAFDDLQRKVPLLSSLFGFGNRFSAGGGGGVGGGYNTNFGASGGFSI